MKGVFFKGQMLVELVLVMGLAVVILPALLTGIVASRTGKPQQAKSLQAVELFKETENAVREVRDNDWTTFAVNGTYHPAIGNNAWALVANAQTVNGFTQQVVISDVYRDTVGNIVSSGGTIDPSTKKVVITVSWTQPQTAALSATDYLTRTKVLSYTQTTAADFNTGTLTNAQVTTEDGDGDIKLGNNNRGKWCSPAFSTTSIDLPDGPPVAVIATASAITTSIPNDVFVITAPYATSSAKLAYINVTADTATPAASLHGIFTLDATQYSAGTYPSVLGGLTNSFATTDVKYYTSSSGNLYALMTTTDPSHEVVVVQIKNNGNDSYQDPAHKIYKYWTFFNTKIYGAAAGNDQAPFGYGAISLTILGNTGYIDSGGYLYSFNLSNIDSKTPTTGLDQVGCRILLDGYECKPGTGTDEKYGSGDTNTTYSDTTSPAHNDCSDGGNIELDADHQLSAVQVGANKYVYVAVGAGTNPELDIADVSTVPTGSSLTNNTCGRGSNTGWKKISSLDFDTASNTEEAANSVYAKTDGTRAYVSSNGGIMHSGIPDSDQFYIIDTSNKTSPKFLTSWPSTQLNPPTPTPPHYSGTAQSGYYNGNATNIELYPRRALTVQNGIRAILVGQDGIPNNGIEPQEYQVLDLSSESTPAYCGGLNFSAGFNDMTSVTEANGDNYVYLVANTPDKQLKVIQGGPDNAIYVPLGTFESSSFDPSIVDGGTSPRAYNRFTAKISLPASASISAQVAVAPPGGSGCSNASYQYVGPNGDPNAYFFANGASISAQIPFGNYISNAYQNPARCFRYRTFLSTTDQTQTPRMDNVIWNYSP